MGQPMFRAGFVLLSSSLLFAAIACGGGKEGGEAKSPTDPSGTSAPASAGSSAGGTGGGTTSTLDGNTGTTTTTQLGDGGDLQGARLGGSVHTETESKGPGGPKSTGGQSAQEPGRTVKDIQAIVVARRDDARACYDQGLAAHPGIEGDLDVKWVIDPQGNVTNAEVDTTKSSILEPAVGKCVIGVIQKIKFAASAKGYETRAHYPFNFHPRQFSGKDAGK